MTDKQKSWTAAQIRKMLDIYNSNLEPEVLVDKVVDFSQSVYEMSKFNKEVSLELVKYMKRIDKAVEEFRTTNNKKFLTYEG